VSKAGLGIDEHRHDWEMDEWSSKYVRTLLKRGCKWEGSGLFQAQPQDAPNQWAAATAARTGPKQRAWFNFGGRIYKRAGSGLAQVCVREREREREREKKRESLAIVLKGGGEMMGKGQARATTHDSSSSSSSRRTAAGERQQEAMYLKRREKQSSRDPLHPHSSHSSSPFHPAIPGAQLESLARQRAEALPVGRALEVGLRHVAEQRAGRAVAWVCPSHIG